MKITILGRGNAGCLTALHYGLYTRKNKEISIELLYDPNIPSEKVGQATLLGTPQLLWNALGINWYDNPIDATPKFGILYDERDNLLHFEGGINESYRAWMENWDSICMHASWKEGQQGYIQSAQDEFETLWNTEGKDLDLGVAVVSLPEAVKNNWIKDLII